MHTAACTTSLRALFLVARTCSERIDKKEANCGMGPVATWRSEISWTGNGRVVRGGAFISADSCTHRFFDRRAFHFSIGLDPCGDIDAESSDI